MHSGHIDPAATASSWPAGASASACTDNILPYLAAAADRTDLALDATPDPPPQGAHFPPGAERTLVGGNIGRAKIGYVNREKKFWTGRASLD